MNNTLTKDDNIFNLYGQLNKSGARTQFLRDWAKEVNKSVNTIKNHWIGSLEIPNHITEQQKDWAITYLQNKIANQ